MGKLVDKLIDQPFQGILLGLGTAGSEVAALAYELARRHGMITGDSDPVPLIVSDHSPPALDGRPIAIPVGSHIQARLADDATLEELAISGRLWSVPPELRNGQGTVREGIGTGNDQRAGRVLFESSKEEFENRFAAGLGRIRSYEEQRKWMRDKTGEKQPGETVIVPTVLSALGGTGGGALPGCFESVQKVAAERGIDVKILPIPIGLGASLPPNLERAQENQGGLVKWLIEHNTGIQPVVPCSGQAVSGTRRRLFDTVLVMTDTNRHGIVPDLTRLKYVVGWFLLLLTRTPVGKVLRENAINIESAWEADRFGIPKCFSTAGLSVIRADRKRGLDYCARRAAHQFLSSLARGDSSDRVPTEAAEFMRAYNLVESDDESLASDRISRLTALNNQSAIDRAVTLFMRHTDRLRGYAKAVALDMNYARVISREIPSNIVPMVRTECRKLVSGPRTGLEAMDPRFLKRKEGPQPLVQTERVIDELTAKSADANSEKRNMCAQHVRPVLLRINNLRRSLENTKQLNRVRRSFRRFTIRHIARHLEMDGKEAIAKAVEIEVRNVLATEAFPALQDMLSERISRTTAVLSSAKELGERCAPDAEELGRASCVEDVPVGIELMDSGFLPRLYERLVEGLGGSAEIESRMMQLFLERYGSLGALAEQSRDEMYRGIIELGELLFIGQIEQMDVGAVLQEFCETEEAMRRCVRQCINESEGRLPQAQTGEGLSAKWIGILGVPDAERYEWLQTMVAGLGSGAMQWRLVSTGNQNVIFFVQYHSQIPVSAVLGRGRRMSGTFDVRRQAASGLDPVTSLGPSLRHRRDDTYRTLIKASVSGALRIARGRGVFLNTGSGEEHLGVTVDEVMARLHTSHETMAEVQRLFAQQIALDIEEIVGKLAAWRDAIGNKRANSLYAGIAPELVSRVMSEAFELRRYFTYEPEIEG